MTPDTVQPPPELENQYDADRVLRSYLHRVLPDDVHAAVEPGLRALGALAGNELYALQQSDLDNEPTLTQWGPWGDRIDQIDVTQVWQRAETIAAKRGVVATAYDQTHGRHSRVHQMALAYLFIPVHRHVRMPAGNDERGRPYAARPGPRVARGGGTAPSHSSGSGCVLDCGPVDDGGVGGLRREQHVHHGPAGRWPDLAAVWSEVVHQRHHRQHGTRAGPTGGQFSGQ